MYESMYYDSIDNKNQRQVMFLEILIQLVLRYLELWIR
jgi:hypothetical protein